jgi:GGDEF domain-containing protein
MNVLAIADTVGAALMVKFMANNEELVAGASIGVAVHPEHGESESDLVKSR